WAGAGSLIIGFGMGFTTIVFLVSIQSSVAWEQRGAATASHVFMRMLGQVLGAAVYGAIRNFGLHRRAPDAIGLVDKLMDPIQRRMLGGAERAELIDALAASLDDVYWVSIALSAAALAFALWIQTGLSPRRHAPAAQRVK